MKNWIRLLVAVVAVACGSTLAWAQSSPPPNPNYTQYNTKADGDIPTPPAGKVRFFYNGTNFRFKTDAGAFTDVGGAGITGLMAGKLTVATSPTAIANSKWTMTGPNLGTATLYDDTAVTGISALVVRAGVNQGTTKAFETRSNADAVLVSLSGTAARIEFGGDIGFTRWDSGLIAPITSGGSFAGMFVENILGTDGSQERFLLKANNSEPFLRFGSGGYLLWTDSTVQSSTQDLGLKRASAGLVKITNGSTGDGSLQVGKSIQGGSTKILTDTVATDFVTISLPTDTSVGGTIEYTITYTSGGNQEMETGSIRFSGQNEGGTEAASIAAVGTALQLPSATMTNVFAVTTGVDSMTISCDADSTALTADPVISFRVYVNSGTATVAPL